MCVNARLLWLKPGSALCLSGLVLAKLKRERQQRTTRPFCDETWQRTRTIKLYHCLSVLFAQFFSFTEVHVPFPSSLVFHFAFTVPLLSFFETLYFRNVSSQTFKKFSKPHLRNTCRCLSNRRHIDICMIQVCSGSQRARGKSVPGCQDIHSRPRRRRSCRDAGSRFYSGTQTSWKEKREKQAEWVDG